ncbi:MAG: hypothetical protein HY700_17345 [Gemmatimonadetes bacterium]|nr:hypothetical protein [Gemmatimonadota bacterium]
MEKILSLIPAPAGVYAAYANRHGVEKVTVQAYALIENALGERAMLPCVLDGDTLRPARDRSGFLGCSDHPWSREAWAAKGDAWRHRFKANWQRALKEGGSAPVPLK